MKILLYLYQYEFTFEGNWDCLFFPNVGEQLSIFSFLSDEDKKTMAMLRCSEVADDIQCSAFQSNHADIPLLNILCNHSCLIEQKSWNYTNNEWVCSFVLKL
ncbi:hypothetical protein NCZ75_17580 [Bacteroides ovatus]|uniref:hypothetical protein n=1 Tax=Bacteroides ovatus TaxID=28116 RepID=UPI00202E1681|nr:hypothetical protein [Bacteroides ovatus]MCM1757689.1 hypothetical protein [Bacteroides ovatus]